MAKLTTKERKNLPAKDFALGKGHEPIENKSHAKAALTIGMRDKTSAQKKRIRAAVHKKYPSLEKTMGNVEHHNAVGSHKGYTLGGKR